MLSTDGGHERSLLLHAVRMELQTFVPEVIYHAARSQIRLLYRVRKLVGDGIQLAAIRWKSESVVVEAGHSSSGLRAVMMPQVLSF